MKLMVAPVVAAFGKYVLDQVRELHYMFLLLAN